MIKDIVLVDYEGTRHNYQIENFDKVISITVIILTGDEVAEIEYEDGHSIRFDCGENRLIGFYDGSYVVPKEEIDNWSNTEGDAYTRQELFFKK